MCSYLPINLLVQLQVRLFLAHNKMESLITFNICIFPLIIGVRTLLLQPSCLPTACSLRDSLKNFQLPTIETHLWISQTGPALLVTEKLGKPKAFMLHCTVTTL